MPDSGMVHPTVPFADLDGLAARWARARRAALRSVAPELDDVDEAALLERAAVIDLRETLRRGFDNSLRLGESYRRFHRRRLSLAEAWPVLAQLGSPCASGVRAMTRALDHDDAGSNGGHGSHVLLERDGCGAPATPHGCDWWRENLDGLVLGLSGELRHTRHDSLGHGGRRCVDVIYDDPESPLRFGVIPDEMRAGLEAVRRSVRHFDSSVDVGFLGISEGVLLYELRRASCQSSGGVDVTANIERGIARRFPELALREMSPRAVIDDDGGCG